MSSLVEEELEEEAGGDAAGMLSHHLVSVKSKKKRVRSSNESPKRQKSTKKHREEEIAQLAVFGSLYSKVDFGSEDVKERESSPLFMVDCSGNEELILSDGAVAAQDQGSVCVERPPAWFDEEDEKMEVDITRYNRLKKLREVDGEQLISGVQYMQRLRAQHAKLNPGTDWARKEHRDYSSGDDASDDEGGDLVLPRSGRRLLPGLIEYTRLVDANAEEPSNAPINSVQFHRNGQLLLAAGLDRRIRFFQVDGKRNPKIESIFMEDCPARKAAFMPDGSEVIVAGRRKFFYTFDLVKACIERVGPLTGREEKSLETFEVSPDSSTIAFVGNEGYILLVSPRTKELIGTVKMNGSARSLAFAEGGTQLIAGGGDGQIYTWDLRTRRCIDRSTDVGSLMGTSICASPDSRLVASGSSSGIVNIYRKDGMLGGMFRKPVKSIENLTMAVHEMKFNQDAQILAICSRMKKSSLKLVHVPSYTVFSNWPGPNVNLRYPRCLDFSPGSGFFTVGNAEGKVLLYKLHHYQNA